MVEAVHTDLLADPKNHLPSEYILKNEIYPRNDDRALVDSYLLALGEMVRRVRRDGESATQALMTATMKIPRDALAIVGAYDLRDQLKARIARFWERKPSARNCAHSRACPIFQHVETVVLAVIKLLLDGEAATPFSASVWSDYAIATRRTEGEINGPPVAQPSASRSTASTLQSTVASMKVGIR